MRQRHSMTRTVALASVSIALCASVATQPTFERVYALAAGEGVFAYARIAPDGRSLAYASQKLSGDHPTQVVTVIDLMTGRSIFTEPGIDAYWSNDSSRVIFLSFASGVSIRHRDGGAITRNIAPADLGDYFSWAVRGTKDLILTIDGNYYYLDRDRAILPAHRLSSCPGLGIGERPLISHDGTRATVFVSGTVVVRDVTDCEDIVRTGLSGAKADFSFDGRYIAFHVESRFSSRSDIVVVDLQERTQRSVTTGLPGSSWFPSWTRAGEICFRYDSPEYKGFMIARNVLRVPPRSLPAVGSELPEHRLWSNIFPAVSRPAHQLNVVLVWGMWSAHSPIALMDFRDAERALLSHGSDVGMETALEPGTPETMASKILQDVSVQLPRLPLSPPQFYLTEARNQIPTVLLFRDDNLIASHLGPMTSSVLQDWVRAAARLR